MTGINIILIGSHFRTLPFYYGLNKLGKIYFVSRYKDDKSNFDLVSKKNDQLINWDDHNLDRYHLTEKSVNNVINKFEKESKYKVKDLIQSDRILRNIDKNKSHLYCAKIISLSYKLFENTVFNICITEPTWAHERIIIRIAKINKCISLHPAPDRFISNSFFFFKDDMYKEIINNNYNSKTKIVRSIKEIKKNIKDQKRINFYDLNKKRNSLNFNKFKNLIYLINFSLNKRGSRYIHYTFSSFLRIKSRNIIKNFYLKYLPNNNLLLGDVIKQDVVYALQVQPEMSIDVAGYEWSNQIETIKFLRYQIPKDYRLLIKEHPSAIGMRSKYFYKKLSEINNIKIIDYDIDSKVLFKKIKAVISITGTICFESFFFRVPSLTLSETYFKNFTVMKEKKYSRKNLINELKNVGKWRVNSSNKNDERELYNIYKNIYVGNVFDVRRSKYALSNKNISKLEQSFQMMYESIKK